MNREPNFDDLVGTETRGAERERLRGVHDLLVQAGPPPELPPQLEKAPTFEEPSSKVTRLRPQRSTTRRVLVLLAAAVAVAAVFAAGYGVGNRGGDISVVPAAQTLNLKGTSLAPHAKATLGVWHAHDGNVPMTLNVVGLRKLAPHTYYDVYLVRGGKLRPWGLCGSFRVSSSSRVVSLSFNAPYGFEKGDSWVVTRPGPGGSEPGKTVLRPISA